MALTVQRSVHPPNVYQQAHHGHVDGRRSLRHQFVLEDLAAFAAVRHGIEIYICKGVFFRAIRFVEDALLVFKDMSEEIVLDVFAPERNAVIFFQMPDLISRVYGRYAPIRIAACRCRGRCVVRLTRICVSRTPRSICILRRFIVVRPRGVNLGRRRLCFFHCGLSCQNVS